MRWLIVGEDLVDAEHNVGKQKRALHRVPAAAANSPGTQDHSASDGYANQGGVDVGYLGELKDTPEEVDGAGYDRRGKNKESNLA